MMLMPKGQPWLLVMMMLIMAINDAVDDVNHVVSRRCSPFWFGDSTIDAVPVPPANLAISCSHPVDPKHLECPYFDKPPYLTTGLIIIHRIWSQEIPRKVAAS